MSDLIERLVNTIPNVRYGMRFREASAIYEECTKEENKPDQLCKAMLYAFRLGYIRGENKAKNETKRKRRQEREAVQK